MIPRFERRRENVGMRAKTSEYYEPKSRNNGILRNCLIWTSLEFRGSETRRDLSQMLNTPRGVPLACSNIDYSYTKVTEETTKFGAMVTIANVLSSRRIASKQRVLYSIRVIDHDLYARLKM